MFAKKVLGNIHPTDSVWGSHLNPTLLEENAESACCYMLEMDIAEFVQVS